MYFPLGALFPLLMSSKLSESLTHLSSKAVKEYVVKIRYSKGWLRNNKQLLIMISTTLLFFVGITLFPLIEAQLLGRKIISWQFYLKLIFFWKFLFLWKFSGFIYELLYIYILGKSEFK